MHEHKHMCPCSLPLLVTHKLLLGSKLKNVQILRNGEANLEDSSHCEDHRTPWIKSVCHLCDWGCPCKHSRAGAGDEATYPRASGHTPALWEAVRSALLLSSQPEASPFMAT